MRPGDSVTLAALLFLAVAGVVAGRMHRISARQQQRIAALGLLGMALIAAMQVLSRRFPVTAQLFGDWLPCLQMLIVYWQAGQFFGAPNQKLQCWLVEFDRRWIGSLLDRFARRWKTSWIGNYFELAYLFCYVLIPLGVGVLYWATLRSDIDQYWATVLPASYLCYVLVPFVQTLPPRMLLAGAGAPQPKQKLRSFNLFILRHASIHLNTFPSAHVASTVGASMVLIGCVPIVGVVFLLIALSIAAGAVLGLYHYSLDVILGAALAIGVHFLLG